MAIQRLSSRGRAVAATLNYKSFLRNTQSRLACNDLFRDAIIYDRRSLSVASMLDTNCVHSEDVSVYPTRRIDDSVS